MASPALIHKKLNVDIDAILAALQVPVVSDTDFIGYAALYVRVSTTDQGERYSPSTQLRQLLLKAARDGYRVRREHIFIDTHTGKIANRPAFDAMKALVKRGGVKAVLIYNVDRLARKTLDALTLATEFKRHSAKLDFVETPYEDSAYGQFTFTADERRRRTHRQKNRTRLEARARGINGRGMASSPLARLRV